MKENLKTSGGCGYTSTMIYIELNLYYNEDILVSNNIVLVFQSLPVYIVFIHVLIQLLIWNNWFVKW